MNHRILAVTGAVAALGAGGGAIAVAKNESKPAPAATFQTKLAGELGVSSGKLKAATKAASTETVDALVKSGRLDAKRAAKIRARIAKTGAAPFAQLGPARKQGRLRRVALQAAAKELGVEPKALRGELKAGKTPAEVIEAAGKDPAAVKVAVRAAVRKALDKPVAGGRLTAAQADARATKIAERLTGDKPLRHKKG